MKDLNEEMIDIHYQFARQLPTPLSSMHMYPVNGAASRVGKKDTPWNYRDAVYGMVIVGIADNPADNDKIVRWARDYWEALHPYSAGGAYVNFMMEEGEDRIKATYSDNYERLAEIKAKYDPYNLFRVNQNIKPKMAEAVEE
jgi:FAD/FMN-containing dehydrogenase